MRLSSGVSALRSAIPRWISTAQRTASTTLGNSASKPSPVFFTVWPRCSLILGSTSCPRCPFSRSCVLWGQFGEALLMALGMFWDVGWSLVLGFAISAVIQAVVSTEQMRRALGRDGPDTRDYILRGRAARLKPPSPENRAEAIALFERALALDPPNGSAGNWPIRVPSSASKAISDAPPRAETTAIFPTPFAALTMKYLVGGDGQPEAARNVNVQHDCRDRSSTAVEERQTVYGRRYPSAL
jgi:hypothetical protein